MQKICLLLLACSFISCTIAQTCDCKAAFDFTRQKIETNYSGFKDKVTTANKAYYTAFTDSIALLTARLENQDQTNCVNLVNKWLDFFKDGHVGAGISVPNTANTNLNKDSIRALYANSANLTMPDSVFSDYLVKNKKNLKPLEGVWQNETGNYKIGLIYDYNHYLGFIIKADSVYWMPGQIKMEVFLSGDSMYVKFYMRDHSLQIRRPTSYDIRSGYFDIDNLGKWFKLDENGNVIFKDYYPNYGIVNFRRLSDKTNLLTIKSFNENYRRIIDSIVTANDKLIQSTDNLIIDIRGNGGGSDISYYPLRKYLFTNPYTKYGAEIYATNDNIQKFRDLTTNPVFSAKEQESYRQMVKNMEQHLNQYWSSSPATFNSDILPVLAKPKKIAVIIDSLVGSTAEQFLLDPVLNSKKATLYGTHSAGVLDYANITVFKIPTTNIIVQYATSRSNRIDVGKGIDNIGVQPNIKLDSSNPDWIKYVWKDIEK